jgi:hypothetical protein
MTSALIKYKKAIVKTLLFMVVLCLPGCFKTQDESLLMRKLDSEKIQLNLTSTELRIKMNIFLGRFSGVVEKSADEIIAGAPDRKIRKQALLWKMNAIPAALRTTFLADPFAALTDTWALCEQMRLFYEEGAGAKAFGEWQPIAVEASQTLEKEVRDIAAELFEPPTFTKMEEFIYKWAKENPIETPLFTRKTAAEVFLPFAKDIKTDLPGYVQNMSLSVDDIKNRLNVYNEHLTKQMRWQVEYLVGEAIEDEMFANTLQNFSSLTRSLEDVTAFVEGSPELIDRTRVATFKEIDRQRLETFRQLTAERIALIAALEEEKNGILGDLDRFKTAIMKDVETLAKNTINESSSQAQDIVNYIFWRAVIILIIAAALAAIVIFFFLRMKRGYRMT